jgi:hypothetical protein
MAPICHAGTFVQMCIPVRVLLAYGVLVSKGRMLQVWAVFTAIIASGFLLLAVGIVQRDTGIETCGNPIWWKQHRPIHGVLYALCAYFAWHQHARLASLCLLADVLVAVVVYRGKNKLGSSAF